MLTLVIAPKTNHPKHACAHLGWLLLNIIKKLFKIFTKEFLLGILWIFFVYFERFFSHNGVSFDPFKTIQATLKISHKIRQ